MFTQPKATAKNMNDQFQHLVKQNELTDNETYLAKIFWDGALDSLSNKSTQKPALFGPCTFETGSFTITIGEEYQEQPLLDRDQINYLKTVLGTVVSGMQEQQQRLKAAQIELWQAADKNNPSEESAAAFFNLNQVKRQMAYNKRHIKRFAGILHALKKA